MTAGGILTKPELKALSGFGTRAGQVAWLEREARPC